MINLKYFITILITLLLNGCSLKYLPFSYIDEGILYGNDQIECNEIKYYCGNYVENSFYVFWIDEFTGMFTCYCSWNNDGE